MVKNIEGLVIVLLIIGLIAVSVFVVIKPVNVNLTGKITDGTTEPENSIQVSGESILTVDPDKAEIIIGVETQEKNALDSQQGNAKIMENVMNALKANGIKKEDIQTYRYEVYPIRNYNSERSDFYEVIAYKTTHMLIVKTTNLDNTGKVIDAAASAGANLFEGVNFGLTDGKQVEYRNKALREASRNARSKADSIADGLGIKVQKVLRVSESSYYAPVYRNYDMVKATGGAMEATTQISPGMIQVSATVTVSYGFS